MVRLRLSTLVLAAGLVALVLAPPSQAQVGIFQSAVTLDDQVSFGANTPPAGGATEAGGVYTITGVGEDVWQQGDECFFMYNNLTGPNSISAKVKWISAKGSDLGGNDWGKIGVMVREVGDDPNSKHYWIEMRCGPGEPALGDRTDAQWREETGQSSGNVQIFMPDGTTDVASPEGIWLRVSRNPANDVCVSEYSFDGGSWAFANAKVMPMQDEVAYGICCTAHTEGTADKSYTVVAEASDVQLGPTALSIPPQPDDFEARTLSSFWTAANIGTGPAKEGDPTTGRSRPSDGQLTVGNNGWDMWEDLDGMAFVHQVVAGDFDVAVHVVALDDAVNNPWEKAGIAFRQSLDPGAAYVSSLVSRANGHRAQYRLTQGGDTNRATRSGVGAGWWVRLKRTGDVFEILAAESLAGPWLAPDSDVDRGLPDSTLAIADPAFLGIAYTPHSTDAATEGTGVTAGTAIFDDFVVMGPELGIFEATVDIDDGNIGPGTAATYDAATDTYTVTGSGADVWGEVDGMRYVYREWSGDFCITADVSLEAGIDEWSKAMLMARQDLSPGSVNISTRMRPEDGQYSTQWRTTADGSSSSTDGSLRVYGLNPGTHRLIRSGNTFYTSCVMDGAWVLVDVNECVMTDPILLGIGVTAHSANALCTGIFSNVTITPTAVTSHAEGYQYYK